MKAIPFYLAQKINAAHLATDWQMQKDGYLHAFAELRLLYPSLAYQALFDLYWLTTEVENKQLSFEQQQALIAEYKNLSPLHAAISQSQIELYLEQALEQAQLARNMNEVPIGAIIVCDNQVIGRGYNRTKVENNILAHAEIIAIQDAQRNLNNHRLIGCDLYVTIEPCLMCSGAIINSRLQRVIYGANEAKTGACISQYNVFANKKTNHHCQVIGPIDQAKYSQLMHEFFRK